MWGCGAGSGAGGTGSWSLYIKFKQLHHASQPLPGHQHLIEGPRQQPPLPQTATFLPGHQHQHQYLHQHQHLTKGPQQTATILPGPQPQYQHQPAHTSGTHLAAHTPCTHLAHTPQRAHTGRLLTFPSSNWSTRMRPLLASYSSGRVKAVPTWEGGGEQGPVAINDQGREEGWLGGLKSVRTVQTWRRIRCGEGGGGVCVEAIEGGEARAERREGWVLCV